MRHPGVLILFLLVFRCSIPATAQHPYYYTINDDNGLPSNEVYDLQQDEFGYMWIGCDAGLFKYDGFRFQQYKNVSQNAVAISGIQVASDRKIYCQNFFGQLFYAENDSLVLFADVKELVKSHPEFTIDGANNVWLGLPDGLMKYTPDGQKEYLFKNEISVLEIESAADGSIYILDAKKGLCRITPGAKGMYSITVLSGSERIFESSRCAMRKHNGRLFILSTTNATHNHYIGEIVGNNVRVIKRIEAGALAEFIYTITLIDYKFWLGTSNGVYCLNNNGDLEKHYLTNEKISDILVDREGTYWFSSLQNGVFAMPHLGLVLLNTANAPLSDNNITALKSASPAELYIGAYNGDIYRFNHSSLKLERLPRNKNEVYRNVTSIIPYDGNTVIAGRGGLSVIDTRTGRESYHHAVYIRDMAMTGDSIIYVSTQSISIVNNISRLVAGHPYESRILKPVSGKKICFDSSSNTMWVTLNEGLARPYGQEFRLFRINGKSVFCNALYADANGLWAGTVADGVYNIKNEKVRLHLDRKKGLIGNNIKCITSHNDTLYIATDECINVRYPNGKFTYIKHSNGINAKEINALSICGPYICIGTIRGLFYIPINTRFQNIIAPNIRITSVIVDGVKCKHHKEINLPYDNKDILVNFSAVALKSRGRFYYSYRIKGFQDEWKKLEGSISNVRLNHLPAGNFEFEVQAINEDGAQSKSTARFSMHVAAPFWQNWWFYLLLVVVASSLVTLLFLLRIKAIRKKADIRDQVTHSQLTALKAQMNPHFMYNTLNSIQDLVLQSDIKNTNYYLSRYSSLMRKILDTSDSNEIELAEETEILELYLELEQLRFGDEFTYTINIAADVDKNAIHIPSMIIQPFVENAIKHGLLHKKGNKHLSLVFLKSFGTLMCTITDNGVGRAKAQEIKDRSPIRHKSFATKATEKRLALINLGMTKKIQLVINDLYHDGVPAGTEVVLTIPLS